MSMDAGIAAGADVLTRYFLGRLNAQMDDEAEAKRFERERTLRSESAAEEEKTWRRREAAKGEQRQFVDRMNGGTPIRMDVGRSFNPDTGQYEEKVYGAMPIAAQQNDWKRGADGVMYRTGADGKLEYDTSTRRPERGAKADKPKRAWVVDKDGNQKYATEDEVAAGGYTPAPTDAKGRADLQRQQQGRAWRQKAGEVAGSVASGISAVGSAIGNTVSSVVTGNAVRPAPAAAPAGQQQAAPEDTQLLESARATLSQNPMARAEIERRLKAMGKESLIPLL